MKAITAKQSEMHTALKQLNQKTFVPAYLTKAVDLGEGEIEAVVATQSIDRTGEVLDMKGLDTKPYMLNPVVLWAHKYDEPSIAKTLTLKKNKDGQLVARMKFAIDEYPFAHQIYKLVKGGYMSAFSIGFIPRDYAIDEKSNALIWTKSEMLEYSVVPVPANSEALLTAKGADNNIDVELIKRVIDGAHIVPKNVIGFEAKTLGARDNEFNFDVKNYSVEQLKDASAWHDSTDAENPDSYRFVHHDNNGHTNFKGLVRSMADLNAGKGNVPSEEREAVYKHLSEHYTEFGEEAPPFRLLTDSVEKYIELLKGAASAVEAIASEVTDKANTPELRRKRIVKKLVRVKKAAQIADKVSEGLINAINQRIGVEQ